VNYAIVDIETTGGSPKNSRITEIAIYKHNGDEIIDEFISLVNPEMVIPAFITQLTGINDEMVKKAPKFFEIARTIVEFTEDCIFVAHNVGFDYGILRAEFKALGYDYRKAHLCTVRASRCVLPGHDSYSLGKLTRALGIKIKGRHRAGGDALATAQLFTLLNQTDKMGLTAFVHEDVNPKVLHPSLDVNILDEIPNKIGIYRFFNENNQLIYIGKSIHIKKRIEQHLRNSDTKKGIQMQREITRIEFELSGSELIALLHESQLVKRYKPKYNRQLKRSSFPYGLFHYTDDMGYIQLFITQSVKMQDIPLMSFNSKREASKYLERMVEEYELCKKLCNIYKTQSSCFQYTLKQCYGACVQEEDTDSYNERCRDLIDELSLQESSFYIVDKGRKRNEKSIILIEKGSLRGFGYAPYHFNRLSPQKWDRFIQYVDEDRDARNIVKLFLRKKDHYQLVSLH